MLSARRTTTPRLFLAACGLLLTRKALAEDQAYCRKVRAGAASEAALLMWPRLILQGIRFPERTSLDVGPTVGSGLQLRAAVTFSPTDFYRGLRVQSIGDLVCEGHEKQVAVERVLANGAGAARLAGLRRQADFLESRRQGWRELAARAEERLSAQVVTVMEFDELRRHVDALELKLVKVQSERKQLETRGTDLPEEAPEALVREYEERTMEAERESSAVRSLDAWQFRVTGGVIPQERPDWYGLAELSVSLGAPARNRHERRYLDARATELRDAPYELEDQWRHLRDETAAVLAEARHELELVERQIAVIDTTRRALETSDAKSVAHARDTIAVEQMSVESDRVFLETQINALTAFLEGRRGS
jgi:hypothetical protein